MLLLKRVIGYRNRRMGKADIFLVTSLLDHFKTTKRCLVVQADGNPNSTSTSFPRGKIGLRRNRNR